MWPGFSCIYLLTVPEFVINSGHMKTFWIFYGEMVMTAVRLPANADSQDVFYKAIQQTRDFPTLNAHWPEMDTGAICYRIRNGEIRTYPNEG